MDSPPGIAFFTLNGSWLGLCTRDALAKDAAVSPQGSGFGGFALAHNVASQTEVDQTIKQALAGYPKDVEFRASSSLAPGAERAG